MLFSSAEVMDKADKSGFFLKVSSRGCSPSFVFITVLNSIGFIENTSFYALFMAIL